MNIFIITILFPIIMVSCSNVFYDGMYNRNNELINRNESATRYFRLIKKIHYYYPDNPDIRYEETYEYDSNNNLIKYVMNNFNIVITEYYYEEYEYNTKNQMIRRSCYESPDGLYEYFTYEYDENGNQTRTDAYDEEDTFEYYFIKEYDNNLLKKHSRYDSDGTLKLYYEYNYNLNSSLILETYNVVDPYTFNYKIYEYDSNNNLIKKTNADENGVTGYVNYLYDEFSRLTEAVVFNNLDEYISSITYEYDSSGNNNKKTYLDSGYNIIIYYIYGYDSNHNNIYTYEFNPSGELQTIDIYEYEEYFPSKSP